MEVQLLDLAINSPNIILACFLEDAWRIKDMKFSTYCVRINNVRGNRKYCLQMNDTWRLINL